MFFSSNLKYLLLLLIGFLISCEKKNKSFQKSICNQRVRLLRDSTKLNVPELNYYHFSLAKDSLRALIRSTKQEGTFYKVLYTHTLNDTTFNMVFFTTEFVRVPVCILRSSFKINIDKGGKRLLNYEEETSFREKFKTYYFNRGKDPRLSDSPQKSVIRIKWEDSTNVKYIENTIDDVIETYWGVMDSITENHLCEYSNKQVDSLRRNYPLHIELDFNIDPELTPLLMESIEVY